MQFKSIRAEVSDLDQQAGIVTAYWSAFGNTDSDGDVIQKGAYARSIADWGPQGANRIKLLWQHDVWEPIGAPQEMSEDNHGLRTVSKVAATTRGRDALILYAAGVLNEHSVGIEVQERDTQESSVITMVRLWEGSVVTWGANPLTPLVGMKGAGPGALDRLASQAAAIRKALSEPLTDETAAQLEVAAGVMEAQIKQMTLAPPASGDGALTEADVLRLFVANL